MTNEEEKEYVVVVYSKVYGKESFTYESLEMALEGLERLIRRGLEQRDAVVRWYRIKERIHNDPANNS